MEDSIKKLVIFKYTQRWRAFLVFILCAQYSLVALDSALPKDDAVLGSRISLFLFSLLITFFFKKKSSGNNMEELYNYSQHSYCIAFGKC